MKKNDLIRWTLIVIVAVLFSNVLQFFLSNRIMIDKDSENRQTIHENKYNIFTSYSSRIQSFYYFLLEIENNKNNIPKEIYLLSQGFLLGTSTDNYSYLEMLIKRWDSDEYNYELNNIIETNKNLQIMIYKLNSYYFTHQNNPKFPENWGGITVLIKNINAQLASKSTADMTLYNITSYPLEFINKSEYVTTMSSLNKKISEVIDIIDN